jgi:hypothetical protein
MLAFIELRRISEEASSIKQNKTSELSSEKLEDEGESAAIT